ncbi:hypothetical protein [uncultured Bacteroides sp.]|jgi:hypothetical protein|uniref:hypothetical protein n=1 Tax=uncultured Bacteroides sp. TaxID=162156 RepID=UPI00261E6ACE|nr:hypothetical protein [uncultured Bacteroides sp.]
MKDSTNFILRIENTESNTNRSLKIVSNSDLESLDQYDMIEKIIDSVSIKVLSKSIDLIDMPNTKLYLYQPIEIDKDLFLRLLEDRDLIEAKSSIMSCLDELSDEKKQRILDELMSQYIK